MINFSLCPDTPIRKGHDERGRDVVTNWLVSLTSVPPQQDASGGALTAALTSSTPLYVTSYQYLIESENITCLNVMVNHKDFRLVIGYDGQIVRVLSLDARQARAQTRREAMRWEPSATVETVSTTTTAQNVETEIYSNADPPYTPITASMLNLNNNNAAPAYAPITANMLNLSPYGPWKPMHTKPIIGGHRNR